MFRRPARPAVTRYNQYRSTEQLDAMTRRLLRKESQLRRKLAQQGVQYDFPGFVSDLRNGSEPRSFDSRSVGLWFFP